MSRKFFGFVAFVATGGGLLLETVLKVNPNMSIGVIAIIAFFIFGIAGHYKELGK